MKYDGVRHTALLIDFENFFLAREALFGRQNPGTPYHDVQLVSDLRTLVRYCNEVSGNTVRLSRSYADFTARREASFDPRPEDPRLNMPTRYEYFLGRTPRTLIELGIEPIQVFRYSSAPPGMRGNKNAVDIRMAMDASALCREAPGFDLLILVSGDSDFIPVVVDCRRHGTRVFGIGVSGATNRNIEDFCDRWEDFSELEAYINIEDEEHNVLKRILAALQQILEVKRSLPAAAVRPELNKVLPSAFTPDAFGCQTTTEFLREHESQLVEHNIRIVRTPDGWNVETMTPKPAIEGEEARPENGYANRPSYAPPAAQFNGGAPARYDGPNYRQLLQLPPARYFVYPKPKWIEAAKLILRALDDFTSAPTYDELVANSKDLGTEADVPPLTISATAYGMCASRALAPVDTFQTYRRVDRYYHWNRSSELDTLDPDASAQVCFRKFILHLINELRTRFTQRQSWADLEIDPVRLASLWAEADPTPEDIEFAKDAIATGAAAR